MSARSIAEWVIYVLLGFGLLLQVALNPRILFVLVPLYLFIEIMGWHATLGCSITEWWLERDFKRKFRRRG